MAIPKSIDLDRIVAEAIREIQVSIKRWKNGVPTDEVAFLNHLTGRLNRRRRNCDVGLVDEVQVVTELSNLHRRGPNTTDRFGSDLAITVSAANEDFHKTAFIQFKKSGGAYTATIERDQLDDAAIDDRILDRAFVAVVDEVRGGIQLETVSQLLQDWPGTQKTTTLNASSWAGVVAWLYRWLSCTVGAESDPTDPRRVEVMLEPYFLPRPTDDTRLFDLPNNVVPARSWLQLELGV